MITISLCMIVKNEADTLARCLDSAKEIADEIIIADTGSTDQTKEIAAAYTDRIYDFKWIGDFSAARNFAFSKGTKDYLLWLDADDVILEEDRARFLTLKQTLDPAVDIVMMPYHAGFDESGRLTLSYDRERLLKNHRGYYWVDRVHEYIPPVGNIIRSDCAVTHRKIHPTAKGRNLSIYRQMEREGVRFTPRNLYYFARELFENSEPQEAIRYFQAFIDTNEGWVEDVISACFHMSACYQMLGDSTQALTALLKSFAFDRPRPEICCQIGYWFKGKDATESALFWFTLAAKLGELPQEAGFILHDCRGYIPYLEMCVCYDRLGERQKAIECNEQAARFYPDSPAVQYNRAFFSQAHKS